MLSVDKNFLFIHVPKSGGTSLRNVLKDYEENLLFDQYHSQFFEELEHTNWQTLLKDSKFRQNFAIPEIEKLWYSGGDKNLDNECHNFFHLNYTQYKSMINPKLFEKLTTFSVVRNPFDRLISMNFMTNNNEFNRDKLVKNVKENAFIAFNNYNPMTWYLTEIFVLEAKKDTAVIDFGSTVDFYLRFEDGFDDRLIKKLCDRLGTKFQPIKHLNKNKFESRKHYSHYYDSELIKLVEDKYKNDLNHFNYSFDKPRKYFKI